MRVVARHLQDRASRLIACLGLGVTVGLCTLGVYLVTDMRDAAWRQAERSSQNLLTLIEQSVARNVEMYDLSLRATAERAPRPDIAALLPEIRDLALFDNAANASGLGAILVVDERGRLLTASEPEVARDLTLQDLPALAILRSNPGPGLVIGGPVQCRVTGRPVMTLSHRITKPDGGFGGMVTGTIELAYFQDLFAKLHIGQGGSVNLFQADGTLLVRQPFVAANVGRSIAGGATFRRFNESPRGTFVENSAIDGAERLYAYAHVGGLPLIVDVALGTESILAAWLPKAVTVGALILGLCLATLGLTVLLQREVVRRAAAEANSRAANAELAALALTDSLTGLPNRRRYDEVIAREWRRASRTWTPLSLLVLDTDHFKHYNDRFGHQSGDVVLKAVARCLGETLNPLDAIACRIGGEEFGIVLPGASAAEARAVAERVRRAVVGLQIPHAPEVGGVVTVSIGIAHVVPGAQDTPEALFAEADAALYEAKRSGRNRVRMLDQPNADEPAARRA
ncbi:GGDEF domain-containing protein [Methylobacterium planeticum]|uniref:diguanylate cyclase n=1 Tax=Methylobacterium planeticum TaxID=2615211 RepID=A0A6N6MYR9_9HYPH|nr:sensor domain-containing diguanylate cyclase [Methylobacterium planeticum]KAB1076326.1 GGDEF domain-containing protein [Methylobacterium planeticum]